MRHLLIRRGGILPGLPLPRVLSEHETEPEALAALQEARGALAPDALTIETRTTDDEIQAAIEARRMVPRDPTYRWDPTLSDASGPETAPELATAEKGGDHANA